MANISNCNQPLIGWLYTTNWVNQERRRRLEISIEEAYKFSDSVMSRLITFGQQYCNKNKMDLINELEKLNDFTSLHTVETEFEGMSVELHFSACKMGFGFIPDFYGYTLTTRN